MIALGVFSKQINSYRIYITWWLDCYQLDLVPKTPVLVLLTDVPLAIWLRSTNWPWPPLTQRYPICWFCFKKSKNKPYKVCSQGHEKILIWHFRSFPEKSISVLKMCHYPLLCFNTTFPVRCRALLLGPLQLEPTDSAKN